MKTPVYPPQTTFKTPLNKLVLIVLGRALESISKHDKTIQAEIQSMPDGFIFGMKILPNHGTMLVKKQPNGILKYCKTSECREEEANLIFLIRNPTSAFLMFTAQLGTHTAYAQHRMSAKGDLSYAMIITRCLNRLQTYLFPGLLAKRILKKVPHIPFGERLLMRLRLYLLAVPFNIT